MATKVNEYVFRVSGEDGTASITLDFTPIAGNCLVIIGGTIKSDTSDTTLATAVSGAGTWATPTNVRAGTEYVPNAFASTCPNCTASTAISVTLDNSSSNQLTGVVQEWTGVPTSSVTIIAPVIGSASSGLSTSTSSTGPLSSTDGVAIFGVFGWGGQFSTPSGWTASEAPLPQQNGSGGFLGGHVVNRDLVAGDAGGFIATMDHDSSSAGTAAIMVLLKNNTAALTIRCSLNTSNFTSADTGITAFVWVNAWPDTGYAYRITGLAGDATAGRLDIPNTATNFPPSLQAGDSVRVLLSNGTDTSGLIPATIV